MLTIQNILLQTKFEDVIKELNFHYGDKYNPKLNEIYNLLKNTQCRRNVSNMTIFIRALKENDAGNADVVVDNFDPDDNTLWFDVCGVDNEYDGIYSIASSDYHELLDYYIDPVTVQKFTYSQILAHVLWEILQDKWHEINM